ncbi:MAG: hypothetical protein Q8P81_01525 [Nanoarchaeota archaeon]|nr:hypothetical protein [Nanoarchaeota archaeon]
MNKKLFLVVLSLSFIGCDSDLAVYPPKSTKIPGPSQTFTLPTDFTRHFDCMVSVQYVNSVENGMVGVVSGNEDMYPEDKGIQFRLGAILLGNHVANELPMIIVNGDTFYTIREGKICWAYISLEQPTDKTLTFRAFSTKKECDTDYHVTTVEFEE